MTVTAPNGSNDNGDNDGDKNNKNENKSSVAQNHYRENWNFNLIKIVITLQRKVCKVKHSDFQKFCDYSISSVPIMKWKPTYSKKMMH